jgi:hypothetical protein
MTKILDQMAVEQEWKALWHRCGCSIDPTNELFSDNEGNVYSTWDVEGYEEPNWNGAKNTDYPEYRQGEHVSLDVDMGKEGVTLYFKDIWGAFSFIEVLKSVIVKQRRDSIFATLKVKP